HDMRQVYARAHIVCLPSYGEGTPSVLLEAAACNCALVATDVPGCREVVQDRKTGLLVPPRNPQALAEALAMLISNVQVRTTLSAMARDKVCAEFGIEVVQKATLMLYTEMLSAR